MLFWIILIALVCLCIGAGFLGYHAVGYNQADNAFLGVFLTTIIGGLVAFGILIGAGSAVHENPTSRVTITEKTYTVAEGSVPKVDGSKGVLEFSYAEDGQIFPYKDYVDPFTIGMEKPKAFKITHYDIVDRNVVPWVIGDNTAVEVIK